MSNGFGPNASLPSAATPATTAALAIGWSGFTNPLVAGVPFSLTLSAVNGTPPYSFSLTSGVLPAGLSFNAGTATISGTPTGPTGTASLVFTVTDHVGATASTTPPIVLTVSAVRINVEQVAREVLIGQTNAPIRTYQLAREVLLDRTNAGVRVLQVCREVLRSEPFSLRPRTAAPFTFGFHGEGTPAELFGQGRPLGPPAALPDLMVSWMF